MKDSTLATLYVYFTHHHSGQWSRGYRILCRAHRAIARKHPLMVVDYYTWAYTKRNIYLHKRLVERNY